MNRRDFLSLRVTQKGQALELSCHRLYMRFLDAQSCAAVPAGLAEDHEIWDGEPPAQHVKPTAEELLADLDRELHKVSRLRVMESEWLESTSLGRHMEPLLASFRARGGQVDLTDPVSGV